MRFILEQIFDFFFEKTSRNFRYITSNKISRSTFLFCLLKKAIERRFNLHNQIVLIWIDELSLASWLELSHLMCDHLITHFNLCTYFSRNTMTVITCLFNIVDKFRDFFESWKRLNEFSFSFDTKFDDDFDRKCRIWVRELKTRFFDEDEN